MRGGKDAWVEVEKEAILNIVKRNTKNDIWNVEAGLFQSFLDLRSHTS